MRTRYLALLFVTALTISAAPRFAIAEASTPLAHVEVRGDGPVSVVLIPGVPVDWRYWEGFMQRNADRYTMYAVSLPGVAGAQAPPPPPEWNPTSREERKDPPLDTPWFDNAVQAIADMMIERGVERAAVVGHAMGGTIALRMAIEHPSLVSAVVTLEGPVATPLHREMSQKQRAEYAMVNFARNLEAIAPEQWDEQMATWTRNAAPDEQIAEFVTTISLETERDVCIQYMVEHQMTDLRQEMDSLRAPLLGVFTSGVGPNGPQIDKAKRDHFRPAWHERIRFYETDDISFFYNLKAPDRFDTEIAEFFKSANVPGADSIDN